MEFFFACLRAYLRHRELDQIAADLRRLDNRELVARNVSHFPGERTALRVDAVPDFHIGRSRRTESILLRNHNDGIAAFSRPFRRTFRPRLVGFLISDSILQATRRARLFRIGYLKRRGRDPRDKVSTPGLDLF